MMAFKGLLRDQFYTNIFIKDVLCKPIRIISSHSRVNGVCFFNIVANDTISTSPNYLALRPYDVVEEFSLM